MNNNFSQNRPNDLEQNQINSINPRPSYGLVPNNNNMTNESYNGFTVNTPQNNYITHPNNININTMKLESNNHKNDPNKCCCGFLDKNDDIYINGLKIIGILIFGPFILLWLLLEKIYNSCLSPCCDKLEKCLSCIFGALEKCFGAICNCLSGCLEKICEALAACIGAIYKLFKPCCDAIFRCIESILKSIAKCLNAICEAIFGCISWICRTICEPIFQCISKIFSKNN